MDHYRFGFAVEAFLHFVPVVERSPLVLPVLTVGLGLVSLLVRASFLG